jgi:hypothetical protein
LPRTPLPPPLRIPPPRARARHHQKMFMARLEMVAKKQQEYHAQLIRDGNQECFKNQDLVSENMPVDYFFFL